MDPYECRRMIREDGVEAWNRWRELSSAHPDFGAAAVFVDDEYLMGINLASLNLRNSQFQGARLQGADFRRSNLQNTNMCSAVLYNARFEESDLSGAMMLEALLQHAQLVGATLVGANLTGANLTEANLSYANLAGANLAQTVLVRTNLRGADLTGCRVYGVSAWDVALEGARQVDLKVTPQLANSSITVDELEIAQFIYLMLSNSKIRHLIDAIASKVVLILGRFTSDRKPALDALRDVLRTRNYTPVIFDFEKPTTRDLTETISTLAHMARFIIADITDAKSIPQELSAIVPNLPSVPVQPILQASQAEYGMFEHFRRYPWVLPAFMYESTKHLLLTLEDRVIAPAEMKVREVRRGL